MEHLIVLVLMCFVFHYTWVDKWSIRRLFQGTFWVYFGGVRDYLQGTLEAMLEVFVVVWEEIWE